MDTGRLLSTLTLIFLAIATCYCHLVGVDTEAGHITGFSDTAYVDGQMKPLTKFLGIPYAEPPTGANRFQKPVPKARFTQTYNATEYPPSCYQEEQRPVPYSEDCLFLNVFVPGIFDQMASYTVMVWIHGGGFSTGTSSYFPADVLSTFGNVVVVTLNYRLGALGFINSADGTFIGNQGLWDQQLALQWVKRNIVSFHGYPHEITVFGESAGSISAIAQSLYGGNKGLFKRIIGQSGSPFAGLTLKTSNAEDIVKQVGCADASDPMACMRAKPAKEIVSVTATYRPVVDRDFMLDFPEVIITGNNPQTAEAKQLFAGVDMLTGVNSVDGSYEVAYILPKLLGQKDLNQLTINRTQFTNIIVPGVVSYLTHDPLTFFILTAALKNQYTDHSADPNNETAIRDMVVKLCSDYPFFLGLLRTIRGHNKLGKGRTYAYELGVTPSYHMIPTPDWITGSGHADDLPYVFGEPIGRIWTNLRDNFTDVERNVSRAMMTMWTNFAKTGNPNTPNDITTYFGTTWPEYDMTSHSYLKITDRLTDTPIRQGFYPTRMAWWLDTLPAIMKAHNAELIG